MKIRLYSDLHLEMRKHDGKKLVDKLTEDTNDVDVLVLAGDITRGNFLHRTLGWFCDKYKQVIYLSGNHERYGVAWEVMSGEIYKAKKSYSNLHILDCELAEIDGVRFLGATLWYPKPTTNPLEPGMIWSDFQFIPGADPWIYQQNKRAVTFLNKELKKDDVIVTHMLPSYSCVAQQWLGEKTNCYYVCDIHDLIVEREPKYCLFGHTHTAQRLAINSTTLICNPLGYDFAGEKSGFNPNLVIEI